MAAPGYLTRQKLTWYFQLAVPRDLQAAVGQRVVRKSMKTRDRREASLRARSMLAECLHYFGELRAKRITEEQRRTFVEKLQALGFPLGDGEDVVTGIASLQVSERREMEEWLAKKRARLLALDPDIDPDAALAPLRVEALGYLRKLDAIAEEVGGQPAREPDGATLGLLFDRWQRERSPAPRSITECEFTVRRFRQLHGVLPIGDITRQHVRAFR